MSAIPVRPSTARAASKQALTEGNVRVSLDLPTDVYKRLRHHVVDRRTTARAVLLEALEDHLSKYVNKQTSKKAKP